MQDNNSNNKRLAKNTFFLYVRSFVLLGISLYTSRLTLDILGVKDFGIYNLVGGVVTMFSILNGAMSSASRRFITYALGDKDKNKVRNVFQNTVILHYLLSIILFVLLEIIGVWFLNNKLNIPSDRLNAAYYVMQFSILTLFVNIVCVPYDALIVAHEKMKAFAYIGIFEAIEKLLVIYILMCINVDNLIFYSLLMFLCTLFKIGIYINYCFKKFEETRGLVFRVDKELFRRMFSFASWNLFGHGSFVLRNQGVDIVMNIFFGVTVNAAKGVCNQVQGAVTQFVTNFQTALYPQVTVAIAEGNRKRAHSLMNQGGRLSFYLLSIISIPLYISLEEILNLWLVEVPMYTVLFIRLTLLYMLLDSLSRIIMQAISATGIIKNYEIVVGGTKLLAVPMTYIYILLFKDVSAGLVVNLILELACLILRLYFAKKLVDFCIKDYLIHIVAKCWIVFSIAILCSFLISHIIYVHFSLMIIITAFTSLIIIMFLGFNRTERKLIIDKVLVQLKKL